jgi:uncharacterized protein
MQGALLDLESSAEIRVAGTIAEIDPAHWNALAGQQPFLRHEFLWALEQSGCVSRRTGWLPQHLALWRKGRLQGVMPLYLKLHSYGEYVFDGSWAQAYHQHGLDYYPKLVSAVPFTPVPGPRLLAASAEDRAILLAGALQLAAELEASSLHCLFPDAGQAGEMQAHGLLLRSGVQFHWNNRGYADFDDYLRGMRADKRKKIRQERRRVAEAGIAFEFLDGKAASAAHWAFFQSCYEATYRAHRSTPYLNLEFFLALAARLPEQLLLVIAHRGGVPIAAALNLQDGEALYGRYWGTLENIPGLHFETCYYQAIDYCIARRLARFEGGAQGEHKLARGFLPVPTCSAHWIANRNFSQAVRDFLEREATGMQHYLAELGDSSPFKAP